VPIITDFRKKMDIAMNTHLHKSNKQKETVGISSKLLKWELHKK